MLRQALVHGNSTAHHVHAMTRSHTEHGKDAKSHTYTRYAPCKGHKRKIFLQTIYNIPPHLKFSYWQLKPIISNKEEKGHTPTFDTTLTHFEKMCLHLTPIHQTLSLTYKHLNSPKKEPIWRFIDDWNKDIAFTEIIGD
ncbi:Hypothetical predicted protein [Pelobates cultripes]|uniref:Uncharacterized protein n=1 Tax=Pelobates cultripes TaxID=61616 RepID=A0AAD1W8F1_PELCU|nr:Hypothetical predicted protein [Pelobates cultripes]